MSTAISLEQYSNPCPMFAPTRAECVTCVSLFNMRHPRHFTPHTSRRRTLYEHVHLNVSVITGGPLLDARRRGKKGLKSSRNKNTRHKPYWGGEGGRRGCHVAPDMSYNQEGGIKRRAKIVNGMKKRKKRSHPWTTWRQTKVTKAKPRYAT